MPEFVIHQEPVEKCTTYFHTAKMIARIPIGENFEVEAAKLIKLYTHHQKLSVYRRLAILKNNAALLKEVLELKVETHENILEEWDTGKWWPV